MARAGRDLSEFADNDSASLLISCLSPLLPSGLGFACSRSFVIALGFVLEQAAARQDPYAS